jgi:transposase
MSSPFLSPEGRLALLQSHRRERDRRVADRLKAVLLSDDGMSYKDIAKVLFLDEQTISQHVDDYVERQKTKPKNGGSAPFLTPEQCAELVVHLDTKLYVKIADIRAYIIDTYNIHYSISGLRNLLQREKFSFHQPVGVPMRADSEAQAQFIEKYEKIKDNLATDDQIYFMDGVHPSHAVRFVRGWIRKGKRVEIPTNSGQKRLNILGALNLEQMRVEHSDFVTLNADSTICFLTKLMQKQPKGLLHIILDQGRYQKCKAVEAFIEQHQRVKLHFLPPYSPNINAIEPLWKIMHEHTTNNQYFASFKAFSEKIQAFFTEIFPKHAKSWTERLTDNFRLMKSPLITT